MEGKAMIRHIAIAVFAVAFLGLAGVLLLSWRRVIGPIERPASESFPAGSVAHGEALAAVWRNIDDIRAGVDEKAGKEWTLTEAVTDFWLARVNDAMYASSGDAVSRASHPGAASSDLGSELDLIAEY
jgi:hypothetical protein